MKRSYPAKILAIDEFEYRRSWSWNAQEPKAGGLLMLLQRAEYDAKTQRAYVEFRARHGDAVATTIFSYRTTQQLSKERLREEVVRMARHLLKRAAAAT
jgi:hypothetical protein